KDTGSMPGPAKEETTGMNAPPDTDAVETIYHSQHDTVYSDWFTAAPMPDSDTALSDKKEQKPTADMIAETGDGQQEAGQKTGYPEAGFDGPGISGDDSGNLLADYLLDDNRLEQLIERGEPPLSRDEAAL